MQLSIWEKESFYAPRDIIIVGGGFTGLWSAYFLKKKYPRLSVMLVDRGLIPTGASTRNAGFATFGSLTELAQDAQNMGQDRMLQVVEMRYRGLERIANTFRKKDIGLSITGGYEMITPYHPVPARELAEKIAYINSSLYPVLKKERIFSLANQKIRRFGLQETADLIENASEGCLHSGKLCMALLQKVQSMGVLTLNQTSVTGYEKTTEGVLLHNQHGLRLVAQQILICTNAFVRSLLPALEVTPARGQILLTAPIERLKIRGAFHCDEGYIYFRNLGNRLLLGGARNKAFEEETTEAMDISPAIQQALEAFLGRYILRGIPYTITDRWSGIMGHGPEKMPIVKKIEEQVYCAVRMSGIGVAITPIIGEQAAALMMQ
ncbi:MAG TPA: FAD-dependent oxidoreductase [Flavitalea sp.]|nr:FAD-dependent oxidoreductase [Flavitalea sp.]